MKYSKDVTESELAQGLIKFSGPVSLRFGEWTVPVQVLEVFRSYYQGLDIKVRVSGVPEGPMAKMTTAKRVVSGKKALNRFYVAHSKISADLHSLNPNWAKPTVEDAITHAKHILEENPNQEEALIVQVIRVVKRRKVPVVVEKV